MMMAMSIGMLEIYKKYSNTQNGEILVKLLKRLKVLVKPVVMQFNPNLLTSTNW